MGNPIDDARPHSGRDAVRTRSTHSPARHVPAGELLVWWETALQRTAEATFAGRAVDVEDYWTELAVGTRLARQVTAGRWVVVTRLLLAGAVGDWSEVGSALDMSGPDAATEFASWLAEQVRLYRDIGIGVTIAEAEDLARLADALGGGAR
ncbi:hypothetical protein ACXIZN_36330 [Amycolatopsis sp. TRM77291]